MLQRGDRGDALSGFGEPARGPHFHADTLLGEAHAPLGHGGQAKDIVD